MTFKKYLEDKLLEDIYQDIIDLDGDGDLDAKVDKDDDDEIEDEELLKELKKMDSTIDSIDEFYECYMSNLKVEVATKAEIWKKRARKQALIDLLGNKPSLKDRAMLISKKEFVLTGPKKGRFVVRKKSKSITDVLKNMKKAAKRMKKLVKRGDIKSKQAIGKRRAKNY